MSRTGLRVIAALALVGLIARPGFAQVLDPTQEPIGSSTIVNSWALSPAGAKERPDLSYSAAPGQQIDDAVTLFNFSNVPLTFRLYATDAFNNVEGGFDLLSANQKPKDVGTWVTLPQENLALPPKSQATFPISIRVPATATPGDHAGAILASNATVGSSPDGKIVNVDRRTGSRVYVRVAGRLTPELVVSKVTTTYKASLNPFSGRNEVTYRVENQGNVRLGGRHRASASGLFGLGGKSKKFSDLPELLPGQSVTLTASFNGLPASFLNFASVKVDPEDVDGKRIGVLSSSAATTAIPFTFIALGAIAALGRLARRSYQRHGQTSAVPA